MRVSEVPARLAIIGGGLSGLTVAHALRSAAFSVVLFERDGSLGGNNFSSTSAPRAPLRFGCALKHHSPCLARLSRELGVRWRAASLECCVRVNSEPYSFSTAKSLRFLPVWARAWWITHMSSIGMREDVSGVFGGCDSTLFRHVLAPIGGINLFADLRDFESLSADQLGMYICQAFAGAEFSFVAGGNHTLVEALEKSLTADVTRANVGRVAPNPDGGVLVEDASFDTVVLAVQPHEAKRIVDASYTLHHEIFDCFGTVRAFSCHHLDHSVFATVPPGTNLAYDIVGSHHYLHIDLNWYHLQKPRRSYVTYWYDTAPCPVREQRVLERSEVVLSRVISTRRLLLWELLMRLKDEHKNLHLANAAYSGYMWHEDACRMGFQVAQGLLGASGGQTCRRRDRPSFSS